MGVGDEAAGLWTIPQPHRNSGRTQSCGLFYMPGSATGTYWKEVFHSFQGLENH